MSGMKKLPQPFNPMQYDPTQSAGMLPVGRHKVEIFDGEVDANSSGTGGLLRLNIRIIEGDSKGATGADNLNLYHQGSAKAVEIAQKRLAAYCHVTQQFQLGADGTDFSVLFNKPFWIDVAPQKEKPEYTEIKKLYDINGNEPGKSAAQQPAQQQNNGFAQQQQQTQQQQPAGAWGNQPAQQQAPEQQNQQAAWGGQQQPAQNQQAAQQGWGNQQPQQQQQAAGGAMPWQR